MISEKFSLIWPDVKKSLHNALVFLTPLVVLYAAFVINNINTDGFVWEDLKPNMTIMGSMILYIFNFIYDLARKFISTNSYVG